MSSTRAALSLALCVALLGACRSSDSLPETTASVPTFAKELVWDELTLGPNDIVHVGVYGHPELGTPIGAGIQGSRIDGQGFLSLPLVGAVPVGGLTSAEARGAVIEAFARYVQDPKVDLSVVEAAARRVYIYGEVQKPGAYVLDRPLNVYQALSLSGGFTSRARRDQIVLLRGKPESLEALVFDGESPEVAGLTALRPDDFVFVRRSGAGKFSDEVLPILTGISSALGSAATLLVLNDQLK